MKRNLLALLCASVCFAQPFEVGGMAGYGAYRNATVDAPAGTATAGIGNRFVVGAVFGEDLFPHLSGEIRYLYQDGDPFVSAAGVSGNIQGQSHALHYDFLIQARRREFRLRPYAIAGAGVKYYRTTGPEPLVQPLPAIVTLIHRNQVSALFTAGAGVRYRLTDRIYVRGDFVDYITPFPSHLFQPAPFGTDRGIFHQFTPTVGITFRP
jgi:hypothetical protein